MMNETSTAKIAPQKRFFLFRASPDVFDWFGVSALDFLGAGFTVDILPGEFIVSGWVVSEKLQATLFRLRDELSKKYKPFDQNGANS